MFPLILDFNLVTVMTHGVKYWKHLEVLSSLSMLWLSSIISKKKRLVGSTTEPPYGPIF